MRAVPRAAWDLAAWFPRAEGPVGRVVVGAIAAVVAVLAGRVLIPILPDEHGAVAIGTLAVVASAAFGGPWAGVLTTGLLAVAIDGAWASSRGRGSVDEVVWGRHALATLFFGVGLVVSGLAAWQRRARAAARESEDRFRRMFDQCPLGVALVGEDHRVLSANAALGRMFGYTPAELVGRTFETLTHPGDVATDVELFERVLAGQIHEYGLTKRYIRRGGEAFWGELNAAVVRDDRGVPDCVIGMVQDVTAQQELQASLERAKGEAEGARQHAEAAREVAEAADRAKDQFLAVLSHELRTPLSPVLLTASALEADGSLPGAVREDLHMIRHNVELEARLIDDLLDVTGIARGKLTLRRSRCDAHALIGQALYMVEREVEEKRLRVEVKLEAPRAEVDGDPARIEQVFWNLIKNAVKFTPAGGMITIRTRDEGQVIRGDGQGEGKGGGGHPSSPAGDYLVVEVTDTGVGIPAETLPKLFRAFEQGSFRVTHQFGGLGLGLAISRSIVEMHGGWIRARSEGVGRGATFSVGLPLAEAGADGAPVATSAVGPGERRVPEGRVERGPLRVLLVEDHPATRRAMAAIVRSLGHEVRDAATLAEAFALADDGAFDLVISDLALPDGSGHDLMRRLKERRRDLHGVAVSGYGMADDVRRSREAGFDEHLTKPVSREKIQEALRHVGV